MNTSPSSSNASNDMFADIAIKSAQNYTFLAGAKDAKLLSHRENAVFAIMSPSNGQTYVLRVHRQGYQNAVSIRSELQWMSALRESGIFTPTILPNADGENVQVSSRPGETTPYFCDVLEWVDGKPLSEIEDPDVYKILGETNGRLHNHAKTWKRPAGFVRQKWDLEGLAGEAPLWGRFQSLQALSKDQTQLIDQARLKVIDHLEDFGTAEDRFGLIHADMMPENVLVHEGQPCLIDFDDCGFGWYLYDLATLLAFELAEDSFPRTLADWVEGYRSVASLPDEHLEKLDIFLMCRLLAGLGWLHTRRYTPMAKEATEGVIQLACIQAEKLLRSE